MKRKHIIEFVGLLITLLISIVIFQLTKSGGTNYNNIGLYTCILSIWVFYAIVVIKIHINEIKNEIEKTTNYNNSLIKVYFDIKDKYVQYGKKIMGNAIDDLKSVKIGIVPLTEQQYYDDITEKSKELKENDRVISVNTFDERRFLRDGRQEIYLSENIKAVKRKVSFTRIFVIEIDLLDINPKSQRLQKISEGIYRDEAINESLERIKAIKENIDGGVRVLIVDLNKVKRYPKSFLEDGVLFEFSADNERFLFIDEQDPHNPMNVLKGELRLEKKYLEKFKKNFQKLSNLAEKDSCVNKILEQYEKAFEYENIK